jgi:Smg protein
MKANLFELLLSLFEKTLTQLKQKQEMTPSVLVREAKSNDVLSADAKTGLEIKILKESSHTAMRILSPDEQMKLTKASYQFILKISSLGIIPLHTMELIMNRLFFSDSRFVSLQETKWTIRSTLAQTLDPIQLAFLELVLYFKEDGLSLH